MSTSTEITEITTRIAEVTALRDLAAKTARSQGKDHSSAADRDTLTAQLRDLRKQLTAAKKPAKATKATKIAAVGTIEGGVVTHTEVPAKAKAPKAPAKAKAPAKPRAKKAPAKDQPTSPRPHPAAKWDVTTGTWTGYKLPPTMHWNDETGEWIYNDDQGEKWAGKPVNPSHRPGYIQPNKRAEVAEKILRRTWMPEQITDEMIADLVDELSKDAHLRAA